jgi:hypothetical protein
MPTLRSKTTTVRHRGALASGLMAAMLVTGGSLVADTPNVVVDLPGSESLIRDGSRTEALAFFQRLVERYRALHRYTEEAEVEQVTDDPATDAPPIRTRAKVRAEVDDRELTVESSSLLDAVSDTLRPSEDGATDAELWMLPHLRLKFDEKPMESFRPATRTPFRASEIDRVRVDDRELVRVELLSGETGAPDAKFSLYVDPDRMLVERVEGDEWLPGGLRHRTTVRIDAQEVHESRPIAPAAIEPVIEPAADPIDASETGDAVPVGPDATISLHELQSIAG